MSDRKTSLDPCAGHDPDIWPDFIEELAAVYEKRQRDEEVLVLAYSALDQIRSGDRAAARETCAEMIALAKQRRADAKEEPA